MSFFSQLVTKCANCKFFLPAQTRAFPHHASIQLADLGSRFPDNTHMRETGMDRWSVPSIMHTDNADLGIGLKRTREEPAPEEVEEKKENSPAKRVKRSKSQFSITAAAHHLSWCNPTVILQGPRYHHSHSPLGYLYSSLLTPGPRTDIQMIAEPPLFTLVRTDIWQTMPCQGHADI